MTTLIVSEKPTAAKRIAESLAEGKIVRKAFKNIPYYEISRGKDRIIVASSVGHLFTLSEKHKSAVWTYPVFDVEWQASYSVSRTSSFSRPYLETLKILARQADKFVNACDWDIEGELIFMNILRFVYKKKDAMRMHFSTLTSGDLVQAYEAKSEHLDFGLAEAGETRHVLDYFWGISASRALMQALKSAGGYKTLSTGRVQGPTLKILEDRQREIDSFRPTPFWEIHLKGTVRSQEIHAIHVKERFWNKKEAEDVLEKTKGKKAEVSLVEKRLYQQKPPVPFDLTTLQREGFIHFGLSPKQTLDTAQSLYEDALISYPRTASQKLPAKIGFRKIMEGLKKQAIYSGLCESLLQGTLKPREGGKTDPAHPAIFPTGNPPKNLSEVQIRVYDLVVKRFLAAFADPAERESIKAFILVNTEKFVAEGVRTIKPGWLEYYKPYAKLKEKILPPLSRGDLVENPKISMLDRETSPPERFTQASILKEMDKLGLGTKATRSQILQTLYDRGYIKEKHIHVTKVGSAVTKALEVYCPDIISVELTKEFENNIELITTGKKNGEELIQQAKLTLTRVMTTFKKNEPEIGLALKEVVLESIKEENTIGRCSCGGDLRIITSKASGKRFIGCSRFKEGCRVSFPVPQKGHIVPLNKPCESCGFPTINLIRFRRRPWRICINNKCPSKEQKVTPIKLS